MVRGHVAEAAARCSLPLGLSLDMLPILEEELLVATNHTSAGVAGTVSYVMGCKPDGRAGVARKDSRLCAAGRVEAGDRRWPDGRARCACLGYRARAGTICAFPDWPSAAEFACAELDRLLPSAPRRPPLLNLGPSSVARAGALQEPRRLAQWSPIIHFCGLPNEEQLRLRALRRADGRGEPFVFRHPDQWTLRWKAGRQGRPRSNGLR